MYHDLLGRPPDTAGEGHWVQALQAGAPRPMVALGFATSPEREGIIVQGDYGRLSPLSQRGREQCVACAWSLAYKLVNFSIRANSVF